MFKFFRKTRLFKGLNDIRNFFYIGKVAKAHMGDEEWKKHGLRVDWVNRIYTVVNLREEEVGEPDKVRNFIVSQKAKPIGLYIDSLGLIEVAEIAIERKSDRSYLIVFYPHFIALSIWFLIKLFLVIGALIAAPFIVFL